MKCTLTIDCVQGKQEEEDHGTKTTTGVFNHPGKKQEPDHMDGGGDATAGGDDDDDDDYYEPAVNSEGEIETDLDYIYYAGGDWTETSRIVWLNLETCEWEFGVGLPTCERA